MKLCVFYSLGLFWPHCKCKKGGSKKKKEKKSVCCGCVLVCCGVLCLCCGDLDHLYPRYQLSRLLKGFPLRPVLVFRSPSFYLYLE